MRLVCANFKLGWQSFPGDKHSSLFGVFITNDVLIYAREFVRRKLFYTSLIFVSKSRTILTINKTILKKMCPETNTLAYFCRGVIDGGKKV